MLNLSFRLTPRAPFRLDLTVWTLRRRPDNAVDDWDGRFYRRILVFDGVPVAVSVRQTRPADEPRLEITAACERGQPAGLKDKLTAVLERTLGLRIDLSGFYEMARDDRKIGALVRRFNGFRPPRFPTIFETLVNAIACQQLTILVGVMLLNRLARTRGMAFGRNPAAAFAFPTPQELGGARPDTLGALGFSRQKASALITLGRVCAGDASHLEALAELDDRDALARLLKLHGIGRWSAEYTMLRGLGRLNVFPADDVAGVKNLHRWFKLKKIPDYKRAHRLLSRWHPYQGLLYFHFLLAKLESHGLLEGLAT
ncbi:MAG: DNA-3-methyladenine glycosylase family protein [Candidatus Acidiferrales bacterium]